MTPAQQRAARNREIVALYRAGHSQASIALKFEVSERSIARVLRLAQVNRLDSCAHASVVQRQQAIALARLRFRHRHFLKLHEARP